MNSRGIVVESVCVEKGEREIEREGERVSGVRENNYNSDISSALLHRDRKRIRGTAGGRDKEMERGRNWARRQKRGDNGRQGGEQIQFDDWIHIAECASS